MSLFGFHLNQPLKVSFSINRMVSSSETSADGEEAGSDNSLSGIWAFAIL